MTKAHARDCSILAAKSRTGPAARLTPFRSWSFVKSPVGRRYSTPPVNELRAWTHKSVARARLTQAVRRQGSWQPAYRSALLCPVIVGADVRETREYAAR